MASENDQRLTKEQLQALLALRSQVSSLVQQAHILNAQAAALHAQMEALTSSITWSIVEASGSEVAQRIFKQDEPSARHFMEPKDAEAQQEGRGEDVKRPRSEAVQVRTASNSGGPRNRGSDSRRQGGSA